MWQPRKTPPTGKTRIWKRPFGMSKGVAIFIGWMLTFALVALYGIAFVSVAALSGSEALAVSGVFGVAGATVITFLAMVIITILIATSYDPDAQINPHGGEPYPY